jgi:hypothetical protein
MNYMLKETRTFTAKYWETTSVPDISSLLDIVSSEGANCRQQMMNEYGIRVGSPQRYNTYMYV